MAYELSEIGNLVVVISGALGSLLLIIFKSRCSSILWGCITRFPKDDSEDEQQGVNNDTPTPPAVPPPLINP